jgi:hypothetical protein
MSTVTKRLLILVFAVMLVASTVSATGGVAKAAGPGDLTTTSGSATYVTGGDAVTVDPGITVSASEVDGARVLITGGFADGDELTWDAAVASDKGISGSYDANSGVLTFTVDDGPVSAAAMQAVLRTVAYRNTADPGETDRTIRFVLGENPYYAAKDHVYEFVAGDTDWTAASDSVGAYYGKDGYLVTVASSSENEFVTNVIDGNTAWIGAKGGGNPELSTVSYQWKWTRKISDDQVFQEYIAQRSGPGPSGDPFWTDADPYANWIGGDPTTESGTSYGYIRADGTWGEKSNSGSVDGYVAEYPAVSAERTVTIQTAPTEPCTASAMYDLPVGVGYSLS